VYSRELEPIGFNMSNQGNLATLLRTYPSFHIEAKPLGDDWPTSSLSNVHLETLFEFH